MSKCPVERKLLIIFFKLAHFDKFFVNANFGKTGLAVLINDLPNRSSLLGEANHPSCCGKIEMIMVTTMPMAMNVPMMEV